MENSSQKTPADFETIIPEMIFQDYCTLINTYLSITSTAKGLFEQRKFAELFANAQKRYRLYGSSARVTMEKLEKVMGVEINNSAYWEKFKLRFSELIIGRHDDMIAETFFNSITRKIFHSSGFDHDMEYFGPTDYIPVEHKEPKVYDTIKVTQLTPEIFRQVLEHPGFNVPYENIERDIRLIFEELAPILVFQKGNLHLDSIEISKTVFYRNQGAFIIGKMRYRNWSMPLIIPILNEENGLFVDAAIYTPTDLSIIFSFTRASFFANCNKPAELIDFLKSMIPHKNYHELFDSIGYYRHGKTMLYRELYNYISENQDQFIIAPGIKGMVMCVFTLKYFSFVFKLIKDKFDNPKTITRAQVVQKYDEVEINDRVGRLAYAHSFENLEFPLELFSQELIDHLKAVAAETVIFQGDKVIVKHAYVERKMTPLNMYVEDAAEIDLIRAVMDYGYCIKELAAANIFPGDLLLKNFGVTRHGRVIFYDYDEICKVTDCNFRRLPQPRDDEDDFGMEMDISVNPNDIFPEEFKEFMVPEGPIRGFFIAEHGDLFEAKWWRDIQRRIEAGEIIKFYAYHKSKRFTNKLREY